jgi:hypothetical protein
MSLFSIFGRKVRGFRVIEVLGLGLLIAVVLTVYLGKTFAGKERNQIADVEQQIGQEQDRVRLLKAEVAYLEQPSRLERLSSQVLGLAPVAPKHETTLEGLSALGHPVAPQLVAMAQAAPAPGAAIAAEATAHPLPPLAPGAGKGGLTP